MNFTIMFNCHGDIIYKYLKMNPEFKKKFKKRVIITLGEYLVPTLKYYNNTDLEQHHKIILKNTDVLILQFTTIK